MKKRFLYLLLPIVALILEILPYGAVCIFDRSIPVPCIAGALYCNSCTACKACKPLLPQKEKEVIQKYY